MTVYVDDTNRQIGRMRFCHLWADTPAELLAMAHIIGVAERWLQKPPGAQWVHFDIGRMAKTRALQAGAVLVSRREIVRVAKAQHDSPAWAEFYK